MQPSGVITITTDFGHKGPFAAVMKGVIVSRFPGATVIDLAHDIPAQWPPEAGFWVSRSYRYFPRGTVHIAIVDPGVGTERDILIVEYDGHYFMAPDNGLLAQMLDDADDAAVFTLDFVSAVIVTVDTFGNLISNIDSALIDGFSEPVARIAGHQIPMLTTYGRAKPGEYLALINSFGVVEIARAESNAAEGLGAERGAPLRVTDGYDT